MKNTAVLDKNTTQFKFLFQNFLEDKRIYVFNQNYWKKTVKPFLQKNIKPAAAENNIAEDPHNIYNTAFADGQKMYDGNPIFSTFVSQNKTLRIVQEEPESEHPAITAWTEKSDFDNRKELVIVLELSDLTKKIAARLIEHWAKDATDEKSMAAFIDSVFSQNTDK